jgi:two-component system C4-dicarboxylate transport sensor histidine kinase DctB
MTETASPAHEPPRDVPPWRAVPRWSRRGGRLLLAGAIAAGLVLAVWIAIASSQRAAREEIARSGRHLLALHASSLEGLLERHRYLPQVVASDQWVRRMLEDPANRLARTQANLFLERLSAASQATALYVMDRTGETLASSNWRDADSFVGGNFAYRPYFRDALAGAEGRFYGIGTTSGRAGYYLSVPIELNEATAGVAVAKVDLQQLEPAWAAADSITLVADALGVVFLASRPGLRYSTLEPLSPAALERIRETRQYESAPLAPLGVVREAGPLVLLGPERDRRRFYELSKPLPAHGWRLLHYADVAPLEGQVRNPGVLAGLAYALAVLLGMYVRQRRRRIRDNLAAKDALERAHRELRRAHEELERKVEARTAELREKQDELVQAGKMAVLGQMSASVTHELNQPLAALRAFSDNSVKLLEAGEAAELRENLRMIAQLTDRMAQITASLKQFSRRRPRQSASADVCAAANAAAALLAQRFQLERVQLEMRVPQAPIGALCEAVRLEQVIVNLLCNALDAVAGCERKRVRLEVAAENGTVLIAVSDSGPGIAREICARLFDPFTSTKDSGLGLGLAISRELVHEWGGSIEAGAGEHGGARFVVSLRTATVPA